jgi:putative PIN family toxin of toxin-antitoxin system
MLSGKAREKIKVVLDVNILVSALFFPQGKPGLIWQLVEDKKIISISCDQIMDKLLEVIARSKFDKYGLSLAEKIGFGMRVRYFSSMIQISPNVAVVTDDPEDDIVLACAVQGIAQYLISGDPHLKNLGCYGEVQVITADDFLNRIAEKS